MQINKFIVVLGTAFSACVPFFASAKVLLPFVDSQYWGNVVNAVPQVVYIIALVLIFLLAMLKGYAHTKFEDVAISVFASVFVPYGFSVFVRLRDMFENEQFGIYLIFFGLICALGTDSGAQLGTFALAKNGTQAENAVPSTTINLFLTFAHFMISFDATADKNAITATKSGVFICHTTRASMQSKTTAVIILFFINFSSVSSIIRRICGYDAQIHTRLRANPLHQNQAKEHHCTRIHCMQPARAGNWKAFLHRSV